MCSSPKPDSQDIFSTMKKLSVLLLIFALAAFFIVSAFNVARLGAQSEQLRELGRVVAKLRAQQANVSPNVTLSWNAARNGSLAAKHMQSPKESNMLGCWSRNSEHRIAFIVPFIESQTERLTQLLTRWSEFHPFDGKTDRAVRDKCDLIFYYHRSEEEHRKQHMTSISAIFDALPSDAGSQFNRSHVRFLYANLTDAEDKYPIGANTMFYKLFLTTNTYISLSKKYRYLMLLEPDTVPIRSRWAWKVYTETLGDQFWMKGSQFHGHKLSEGIRMRRAKKFVVIRRFCEEICGYGPLMTPSPAAVRYSTVQ